MQRRMPPIQAGPPQFQGRTPTGKPTGTTATPCAHAKSVSLPIQERHAPLLTSNAATPTAPGRPSDIDAAMTIRRPHLQADQPAPSQGHAAKFKPPSSNLPIQAATARPDIQDGPELKSPLATGHDASGCARSGPEGARV